MKIFGKNVKQFSAGDKVFGTATGLKQGAYAEYICVPEKWKQGVICTKPTNISFDEAATIPIGGMAALHLLKKAKIGTGKNILIYGASGSVGTFGVQLAKHFGAIITGVCSTTNIKLVKLLGAKTVIDYTEEDYTKNDNKYDFVFDAVGKINKSQCKNLMTSDGRYITVKSPTKEKVEYLEYLKKIIEKQEIHPVIDKVYPLEKIKDAHKYVDKGHKKGNVVISIIN